MRAVVSTEVGLPGMPAAGSPRRPAVGGAAVLGDGRGDWMGGRGAQVADQQDLLLAVGIDEDLDLVAAKARIAPPGRTPRR